MNGSDQIANERARAKAGHEKKGRERWLKKAYRVAVESGPEGDLLMSALRKMWPHIQVELGATTKTYEVLFHSSSNDRIHIVYFLYGWFAKVARELVITEPL
jgi:hypothetical protein